jgi:hypothetical protein
MFGVDFILNRISILLLSFPSVVSVTVTIFSDVVYVHAMTHIQSILAIAWSVFHGLGLKSSQENNPCRLEACEMVNELTYMVRKVTHEKWSEVMVVIMLYFTARNIKLFLV